jgi:hypothetical protein
VTEAFFATLECELIDRHFWVNREEGRRAIFDYIEGLSQYAPASLDARLPVAGRIRELVARCPCGVAAAQAPGQRRRSQAGRPPVRAHGRMHGRLTCMHGGPAGRRRSAPLVKR